MGAGTPAQGQEAVAVAVERGTETGAEQVAEGGAVAEEDPLTDHVWPVPVTVDKDTLEKSLEELDNNLQRAYVRYMFGDRPAVSLFEQLDQEEREEIATRVLRAQSRQLARLPNPPTLLSSHTRKLLTVKFEELTRGYKDRDGVGRLVVTHNVLALLKMVHSGQTRRGMWNALKRRIARYPHIAAPERIGRRRGARRSELERAQREVEQERVGRAARIVYGESSVLEPNAVVMDEVKRLFPEVDEGEAFSRRVRGGAVPAVPDDKILKAVASFKKDTSAGVPGMTREAVQCVVNTSEGREFVRTLVKEVRAGHCPSTALLSIGAGLALAKDGGGVRPIVITGVLFRAVEKLLLGTMALPGKLLKCQLGVGTEGGVEPIVHCVNAALQARATASTAARYTHLTLLDVRNAYNSLSRRAIAESVYKWDRPSYNACKVLLGQESEVVFTSPEGEMHTLRVSTGVCQGSVLSPALFSMGLRPRIEALEEWLKGRVHGEAMPMMYLDDCTLLSAQPLLPELTEAWEGLPSVPDGLKLNPTKCKSITLAQVMEGGLNVLGTPVGGSAYRRARVRAARDKLEDVYRGMRHQGMGGWTKQSQLLVLRQSLVKKHLHWMRTMDPNGVEEELRGMDKLSREYVRALKGRRYAPTLEERQIEQTITGLPTSMGGLGITAMAEVHRAARMASVTASIRVVHKAFKASDLLRTYLEHMEDSQVVKEHGLKGLQRRCTMGIHERKVERLLEDLGEERGVSFIDGAHSMATQWLTVLPSPRGYAFDDTTVERALCSMTMTSSARTCAACQCSVQDSEHYEQCFLNTNAHHLRHRRVLMALTQLLKATGASVETEVQLVDLNGHSLRRCRGDASVTASDLSSAAVRRLKGVYDVTVLGVSGKKARECMRRKRAEMEATRGPGGAGGAGVGSGRAGGAGAGPGGAEGARAGPRRDGGAGAGPGGAGGAGGAGTEGAVNAPAPRIPPPPPEEHRAGAGGSEGDPGTGAPALELAHPCQGPWRGAEGGVRAGEERVNRGGQSEASPSRPNPPSSACPARRSDGPRGGHGPATPARRAGQAAAAGAPPSTGTGEAAPSVEAGSTGQGGDVPPTTAPAWRPQTVVTAGAAPAARAAPTTKAGLYRVMLQAALDMREQAKRVKYARSVPAVTGWAISSKGTMSRTVLKMLDNVKAALESQPRVKAAVLGQWRRQVAVTLLLSRVYHQR